MGADEPMMRARQRGHRICHHPWCGPDDERPLRERRDDVLDELVHLSEEMGLYDLPTTCESCGRHLPCRRHD